MFVLGHQRRCRGHRGLRAALGQELRQAEIEQLGMAARGHKDVRWLDVAMDDATGVRRVERFGNLHAEVEHFIEVIGRPVMRCFNVLPSRNSITMKYCPSCSPISWMVQILGWFSAEAERASRLNRSTACESLETSSAKNFSATGRPRLVSSAL